jgi:hypothetical protein
MVYKNFYMRSFFYVCVLVFVSINLNGTGEKQKGTATTEKISSRKVTLTPVQPSNQSSITAQRMFTCIPSLKKIFITEKKEIADVLIEPYKNIAMALREILHGGVENYRSTLNIVHEFFQSTINAKNLKDRPGAQSVADLLYIILSKIVAIINTDDNEKRNAQIKEAKVALTQFLDEAKKTIRTVSDKKAASTLNNILLSVENLRKEVPSQVALKSIIKETDLVQASSALKEINKQGNILDNSGCLNVIFSYLSELGTRNKNSILISINYAFRPLIYILTRYSENMLSKDDFQKQYLQAATLLTTARNKAVSSEELVTEYSNIIGELEKLSFKIDTALSKVPFYEGKYYTPRYYTKEK